MASRALVPAFDQRHPAVLNRLPRMCLQALSTTLGPVGNPCALHSVRVGLAGANAGRDGFGPVAVRLRNGHRLSGPPAVRESSETAPGSTHAEPPESRLQPSNTEPGRNAKTQNQLKPKKMGCTRYMIIRNSKTVHSHYINTNEALAAHH